MSLWAATLSAGQASPGGPLPAELRAHLQEGRFDIVTSLRGLPLGVRNAMSDLFGGSLDIAEPDVDAKGGRRLVSAGCTTTFYCLVYYERGGAARTRQVALFRWTPDATRLEWGATAPAGLSTIEDVRKAVLSGAIREPAKSW